MENIEIFEKLKEILTEVFDDESIIVTESSSSDTIEEWDSLAHVQIVNGIKKTFGIKINAREMMDWDTVSDIIDTISKKING